jgi:hypothetical protein
MFSELPLYHIFLQRRAEPVYSSSADVEDTGSGDLIHVIR